MKEKVKSKNFLAQITILDLINKSPLSHNDSAIVLEDLFGFKRSEIQDAKISNFKAKRFFKIANKINSGYPLQYAVGFTYFLNNKILLNNHVLIPRFETEQLVQIANDFLKDNQRNGGNVIDVGTGSGAIAIALDKYSNYKYFASDVSPRALKIASRNAELNKTKINFVKSDLLGSNKLPKKFTLICANLPYIDESSQIADLRFEPKSALYCSDFGFDLISKLIHQLPQRLEANGMAIFEIGYNHQDKIIKLSKELNNLKFSIQKDLNDFPRYLIVRFKKDKQQA